MVLQVILPYMQKSGKPKINVRGGRENAGVSARGMGVLERHALAQNLSKNKALSLSKLL